MTTEIKTYRGNKLLFINQLDFDTICIATKKHTKEYDIELIFINKDGSRAKMCGNALVQTSLDWFNLRNEPLRIKVGNVILRSLQTQEEIRIEMPKVKYEKAYENENYITANIGNNHNLYFYPKKVYDGEGDYNISIIEIINDTTIFVDTWERGVGKTESCGSAACCAAWVYCKEYLKKDAIITVKQTGGDIIVDCTGEFPILIHKIEDMNNDY